jgi:Flp pilus assembly pilin Flp
LSGGTFVDMTPRTAIDRIRKAERDDRGATAVEYALMITLVSAVILVGVAILGGRLSSNFASAAEGLSGSVPQAASTSSGTTSSQESSTPSETTSSQESSTPTGTTSSQESSTPTGTTSSQESSTTSASNNGGNGNWNNGNNNASTCIGIPDASEKGTKAPSCSGSSSTWICPRNYELERVNGHGASTVYTCKK